MMNLDDFKLVVMFFRTHGIDPTPLISMNDYQRNYWIDCAQQWEKQEKAWRDEIDNLPEEEQEELLKARKEQAHRDYLALLYHSSG